MHTAQVSKRRCMQLKLLQKEKMDKAQDAEEKTYTELKFQK